MRGKLALRKTYTRPIFSNKNPFFKGLLSKNSAKFEKNPN